MTQCNEPSEREWLEGLRYEDKFPPRGAPGCTCGTPPFAPPEPSDDCPFHAALPGEKP